MTTSRRPCRAAPLIFVFALLAYLCPARDALAGLADSAWPTFRHDLHRTGRSPYRDAAPGGTPWKFQTDVRMISSCAITPDGTIYVGAGSFFYSLNADGTFRWRADVGSNGTRSSPAIAEDGTVYIGANDRLLYAFNRNGTPKWSYATGDAITGSPAISHDGTVYIGSRDGYLHAVNPDGTRKWACRIYAVHVSSPAIGPNGTIYIGATDGCLYAVTPNGKRKWQFQTDDQILTAPAISPDGSRIYFGSWDANLYCVDKSGKLVWASPVAFLQGCTPSSPALGADGTVYVGSNKGALHSISPSGVERWRYETGSDVRASSPAISADGTIYFGTKDGFLYALHPNGTLKWRYLTADSVCASPVIDAGGNICVGSYDGYIYGGLNHTPPAPDAPANPRAAAVSETEARLDWDDNASDEYGFRIERRNGATAEYELVGKVEPNVTTFTDKGLATGRTYYYRISSYQGGGFAYSPEVSAATPGIPTPCDLAAKAVGETRIDLSWTAGPEVEGYTIERADGQSGRFREIAVVGPDVEVYRDEGLAPASDYYYRTRAFTRQGNSTYTDEVWAATAGRDYTEIATWETPRHEIALTFDAGTSYMRPGLLRLLREYGVRSTFFAYGPAVEASPGYWIEVASDGHEIGNHTYDHPPLPSVSDAEIRRQLILTDEVLYRATGRRSRPLFRAPFGYRDERVLSIAKSIGFRHVFWTVDSGDATWRASTQEIIDRTLENARDGAVIVYHCTVENTERAMRVVIPELLARGYSLVTVSELVDPVGNPSPPRWLSGGWNLVQFAAMSPSSPETTRFGVVLCQLGRRMRTVLYGRGLPERLTSPESRSLWLSAARGYFGQLRSSYKYAGPETVLREDCDSLPFARLWSDCVVYNREAEPPQTRPIADAAAAGWISKSLFRYDACAESLVDIALADVSSGSQMDSQDYWLLSRADSLSLLPPP